MENKFKQFAVPTKCKDILGTAGVLCFRDSSFLYFVMAKHNVFGMDYSNNAKITDITIITRNRENQGEILYQARAEDKLYFSDDKDDMAVLRVLKKNINNFHVQEIFLAKSYEKEYEIKFAGFPNYSRESGQTIKADWIKDDDHEFSFELFVPEDLVTLFDPTATQLKGFSGSPVISYVDGKFYYFGTITDYRNEGQRFIATNVLKFLEIIEDSIEVYEPWIEGLLSKSRLKELLDDSVKKLGPRFDEESHYPVEIEEYFHGFFRDSNFVRKISVKFLTLDRSLQSFNTQSFLLSKFLDEYGSKKIMKEYKDIKRRTTVKKTYVNGIELFSKIKNQFFRIKFEKVYKDELKPIFNDLEKLENIYKGVLNYLSEMPIIYSIKDKQTISMIAQLRDNLRVSSGFLDIFIDELRNASLYIDNSVFLINGPAGNGKSQLLGHMATKWLKEGNSVVLLLGQLFENSFNPRFEILSLLKIQISWNKFLQALNTKALQSGKRSCIIIDALNEGSGLNLWKTNLSSLVKEIENYPGITMVMSYRTSFRKGLFGSNGPTFPHLDILHEGFKGKEKEAMKNFFSKYGIDQNSVAHTKEFANPLFLKLFCLSFANGGPLENLDSTQSIFAIIKHFLKHVNTQLGKTYDYRAEKLNLVERAVNIFIDGLIANDSLQMRYEEAFLKIDEVVNKFLNRKGFVNGLIDEEVLYENLGSNEEYMLDFSYQRFGEHLKANVILGDKTLEEIKDNFLPGGILHELFTSSPEKADQNSGLLEAIGIQISDKFQTDLLTVAPFLMGNQESIPTLIRDLVNGIHLERPSKNFLDFIRGQLINDNRLAEEFFLTAIENIKDKNRFNALDIHNLLVGYSMADRDYVWTIPINRNFHNIKETSIISVFLKELANTQFNREEPHSEERLFQQVIVLIWFFSSSNRTLRDYATKIAITVLSQKHKMMLDVFEIFKNVNDPYLRQRLYAVIYGVVSRAKTYEGIKEIGNAVFKEVFDQKEIIPDILLRDYARETLEWMIRNKVEINVSLEELRPTYQSDNFGNAPTNNEIDSYKSVGVGNYTGLDVLIHSMVTEYGRGTSNYGDFGRYVFGNALKSWKDVDENSMSNLAVKMIIEKFGYDISKHGSYDINNESGRGRRDSHVERIGKKYQWIALYEILAKISDREIFIDRWDFNNNEDVNYKGPWLPFLRNIDPTLIRNIFYKKGLPEWMRLKEYVGWSDNKESWFAKGEFMSPDTLINRFDGKNDWLVLQNSPEFMQKSRSNRLSFNIKSYICKKEDLNELLSYLSAKDSWDSDIHQTPGNYQIFNREYYNSLAYSDFDLNSEVKVSFTTHQNNHLNVENTAIEYNWESEYDYSNDRDFSFYKLSFNMVKLMSLIPDVNDGEYHNKQGDLICLDTAVAYGGKQCLMIRKHDLLESLEQHNMRIIWNIYGEKREVNTFSSNYQQASRTIAYLDFKDRILKWESKITNQLD